MIKSNIISVLRWVSILPGAIIAATAAYYFIEISWNLSLSFFGVNPDGPINLFTTQLAANFLMGMALIVGAGCIAPKNKKICTAVVGSAAFIFIGIDIALEIFKLPPVKWSFWVQLAAVALGVGYAVYYTLTRDNIDDELTVSGILGRSTKTLTEKHQQI